jgi:Fe(3+) dicitrate transport protein
VPIDNIAQRNVFTPEQVKETGARDLNDLVQNLPGVSTRPYNGGEAAAPSFATRGLPDDGLTEYIHIMIDGVPASAMPYGWTAFSFMPVTVERVYAIDQIRSAFTVRYSPNSVGGVVNFITRPIPDEPEAEIRTTYGSYNYSSSLFRVGGTQGKVGAQVTFVNRSGDGFRDEGEFDQQDLNVKLRYDIDATQWAAFSFSHFEDYHKAPGGLTQAQFDDDRFANARPLNRFEGYRTVADAVYHSDVDESFWFEAFGYGSATGRDLKGTRPQFGDPTEIRQTEDVAYFYGLGVRTQKEAEFLGMENVLYAGVRFHDELFPSSKTKVTPIGTSDTTVVNDVSAYYHTLSAHVDDTFSPIEDLEVTLGARLEWVPDTGGEDDITGFDYEDDFFRVLPGLGASYLLLDEWSVFASYFEGFRAPQVWGYQYAPPAGDLDFEIGRIGQVGTRVENVVGLNGSIAFWRTIFDDYTTFYSGFYENLGKIDSRGIDVELFWEAGDVVEALEGFGVGGSITFMDSELKEGPNKGNDVPYAWDHKAAWRARYALEGWALSIGGVLVGESYSDEANTKDPSADGTIGLNDGWTLWDAQIAKSIPVRDYGMLDLSAGVTNLLDTDWEVHSRGGFFGGGLVAGAPRQMYFNAGLTVKF